MHTSPAHEYKSSDAADPVRSNEWRWGPNPFCGPSFASLLVLPDGWSCHPAKRSPSLSAKRSFTSRGFKWLGLHPRRSGLRAAWQVKPASSRPHWVHRLRYCAYPYLLLRNGASKSPLPLGPLAKICVFGMWNTHSGQLWVLTPQHSGLLCGSHHMIPDRNFGATSFRHAACATDAWLGYLEHIDQAEGMPRWTCRQA